MANNNHFQLTLDTLAPAGSITRPKQYLKENETMTITKDSGATYMKVWFDQTPVGTKDSDGYKAATWEAAAESYTTKFTETKGGLYYHLVLMDDVANESEVYNTEVMVYDTSAPIITEFKLFDRDTNNTNIVNETTIGYSWTVADPAPAPVAKFYISGDAITSQEIEVDGGALTYTDAIAFIAGTEDGTKKITLIVEDKAGNKSAAMEASIVLDTKLDTPILVAVKSGTETKVAEWINYHDVDVTLTCNDDNIEAYKIWEGNIDNEPGEWTTQEVGTLSVTTTMTLSENDGVKTICAKVRDAAKNIQSAEAITTTIDTVKPTTTFTTDKTLISRVDGFTTAVLGMTAEDTAAGIVGYTLKCGNETIASGATAPATFNLTADNSMVEGENILTFTVTDKAGNVEEKSVSVTLDTTAPADVAIGTLNEWYNAPFNIQVSYTDAHIGNGKGKIFAWVSSLASDTAATDVIAVATTQSPQDILAENVDNTPAESATNYLHVKVVDEVGNVSYDHKVFGYDSVKPDTPVVSFVKDAYSTVNASVSITYNDATSGVVSMQVSGDITDATAADTWEEIASTRSVTLTSTDGDKRVYVRVKDKAGNVSELSAATVTELDKTAPGVLVTIFEQDGVAKKPAHSPLDTFVLKIEVTDDDTSECRYQVYGDVTKTQGEAQGITESETAYVAYTPVDGKAYVEVSDLYATAGDGLKEIYVKVIDNAGNVTTSEVISFTLDTEAPVVAVSDIDYNRISKVHVERLGAGAGKYADEVNFTFTPDSYIKAYKVCAYADEAAAKAGNPDTDVAIGNANGSVNMAATGLESNKAVKAMIRGADFEAALGEINVAGDNDGLHIVVVYVQDYAGTWSALADFTV